MAHDSGTRTFTDDAGVRHLTPLAGLPSGHEPHLLRRVNSATVYRQITAIFPGKFDVVLVDQPLLWAVVPFIEAQTVVYRPTDMASSLSLAAAESAMASLSQALVTTSQPVLENLPQKLRGLPHLRLSNGVDLDVFQEASPRLSDRSGVIYIGALDDRFDWPAVSTMAIGNPSERFDLYGPVIGTVPAPLPANVFVHGPVAYEHVPQLLGAARVGLLPFTSVEWNAGRSPMKLYEYLAMGLNVLGGNISHLVAGALPGVSTYSAETDVAQCLRRAVDQPINTSGRAAAEHVGWATKSDQLLAFLTTLRSAR